MVKRLADIYFSDSKLPP